MANARAALGEMVKELSRELGEALEYDDEIGECVLARDDGQEVVILAEDESDAIYLMATVAPMGGTDRLGLQAWLLEENLNEEHLSGMAIGLDRNSDYIVVRHRVPLVTVNATSLNNMMMNIFGVVDALVAAMADRIAETGLGEGPLSDDATDEGASARPGDFA